MELALNKVTFINVSAKFKFALASLLPIDEVTRILDFIVIPLFSALAIILIIGPFAFVHRSILINEYTSAARLSFFPFAVIDVSIFLGDSSLSMKEAVVSHSLIDHAICEFNGAEALPSGFVSVCFPLSLVLLSLANIYKGGIPIEAFASMISAELIGDLVVSEQNFISGHQLSIRIKWLSLSGYGERLHGLLELSAGKCAHRPPLDSAQISDVNGTNNLAMFILHSRL